MYNKTMLPTSRGINAHQNINPIPLQIPTYNLYMMSRALHHNVGLGVIVPDHVHQEAVQHRPMTNSLEEGQIFMEDDDDSLNNVLKGIDRWN